MAHKPILLPKRSTSLGSLWLGEDVIAVAYERQDADTTGLATISLRRLPQDHVCAVQLVELRDHALQLCWEIRSQVLFLSPKTLRPPLNLHELSYKMLQTQDKDMFSYVFFKK